MRLGSLQQAFKKWQGISPIPPAKLNDIKKTLNACESIIETWRKTIKANKLKQQEREEVSGIDSQLNSIRQKEETSG